MEFKEKDKNTLVLKQNKKILNALTNIVWTDEQYNNWKKDVKKVFGKLSK